MEGNCCRFKELLGQGVVASARRSRYQPNEPIFHQGDPATSVHVVETGRVAVRIVTEAGGEVTVAIAARGDVLGELALLAPWGKRSAGAFALEEVVTRSIDRPAFDALRRDVPAVTDLLLALLAERVRQLDQRLIEALYVPAEVRVLRRLLEMVDLYGSVVPLRQEDLAGLAGTTRATVNRVLRRAEQLGVVSLARARVEVTDSQSLALLASAPVPF